MAEVRMPGSSSVERKKCTMKRSGSASRASLTLSIIQLEHSIDQIDRPIAEITTLALDKLQCSTPSGQACNPRLIQKVEKSVIRFLRDQDRWTALTSLLLKSLAFYRSRDSVAARAEKEDEDNPSAGVESLKIGDEVLPVVDLPRTEYNRPYLPRLGREPANVHVSAARKGKAVDENFNSMMNVSHQYPWVCMVQKGTGLPPMLGLDLVTFDARLSKYTPTIEDFLKSFVASFTPWEWDRISHCRKRPSWTSGSWSTRRRSEDSKLREFYLRWSMKEAYTKALGMGMHIEFNQFETKLCGVDIDANNNYSQGCEEGIWEQIMAQEVQTNSNKGNGHRQLSVTGKVQYTDSPTPLESWEFIFIPLGGGDGVDGSTMDHAHNSCACICRGPLLKDDPCSSAKNDPVNVQTLTLADLLLLHGCNPL